MKVIITCLVCIITQNIFAQIPYTDFIQNDTAIQWAAEYDQILNITPKISRYGIRNIIHSKLLKGECIDNYTTNNDGAISTKFCLKDTSTIKEIINSNILPYNFRVNHEALEKKGYAWSEMPEFYNLNIQRNLFHIYNIKQLISYKNGKLSVQNTLISPIFLRKINDPNLKTTFSWYSLYATGFNNSNKKLSKIEKLKCVDLGNTEEKYDFHYSLFDTTVKAKIFTQLNPILSKHIYEDILAKKISAVDILENLIPSEKILEVDNPEIEINEYDKEGNIKGIIKARNEINLDSLYNFTINQHFYYDTTNNVLHSEINFMDVNKRFITTAGLDFGIGLLFRIYFVKPFLYKRRPQKRFLE